MRIAYLDTRPDLSGITTLIFTSAHGVAALARMTDRRDIPCYAVGAATTRAAISCGFQAIDAGGDAKALCKKIIADGIKGPCLHIRGEHAAGDVAGTLSANGCPTRAHVAYRQVAIPLSDEARNLIEGENPVLLPLFSPRSAALFFDQVTSGAPMLIAAISQAVADHVPAGKEIRLLVAKSPDTAGIMEALAELRSYAIQLEGRNRSQ
jgi:uroporphyrinogen-III synthase